MAKEKEKNGKVKKQTLKIKLKGYDHKVLDKSCQEVINAAQRHDANIIGPVPLPTEKHRYTVNRATFVHNPSKEQFEIRIHKRLIELINPNQELVNSLMRLSLPAGVQIEIKA